MLFCFLFLFFIRYSSWNQRTQWGLPLCFFTYSPYLLEKSHFPCSQDLKLIWKTRTPSPKSYEVHGLYVNMMHWFPRAFFQRHDMFAYFPCWTTLFINSPTTERRLFGSIKLTLPDAWAAPASDTGLALRSSALGIVSVYSWSLSGMYFALLTQLSLFIHYVHHELKIFAFRVSLMSC